MNAAIPVRRVTLILGALLALAISGCDMGPGHMASGHMGLGHMMGSSVVSDRYANNGERIYFTGTSASGDAITRQGGNLHMRMMGGGCATCHGSDRQGGRLMPQFWETAPPLTREALFGEHHHDSDGHGGHEGYTDDTLRRAVFQGADPAGNPLDEDMPRWSMSSRDWEDLLAYLRS